MREGGHDVQAGRGREGREAAVGVLVYVLLPAVGMEVMWYWCLVLVP
jgi:hypothetical protein